MSLCKVIPHYLVDIFAQKMLLSCPQYLITICCYVGNQPKAFLYMRLNNACFFGVNIFISGFPTNFLEKTDLLKFRIDFFCHMFSFYPWSNHILIIEDKYLIDLKVEWIYFTHFFPKLFDLTNQLVYPTAVLFNRV